MSRRSLTAAVADQPQLSGDNPLTALEPTLPELHAAVGYAMEGCAPDAASYLRGLITKMEREAEARRWPPAAERAAEFVRRVRDKQRKE